MKKDYVLSAVPLQHISIRSSENLTHFVELLGGVVVEGGCDVSFTSENAQIIRNFLRGESVSISDKNRSVLSYLADNPGCENDEDILWSVELKDLWGRKLLTPMWGCENEWDLIHYLPARYLDKSNPQKVSELVVGELSTVVGEVVSCVFDGVHNFTKMVIRDISGERISATFFRQPWIVNQFVAGETVLLYGKYTIFVNGRGERFPQIASAQVNKVDSGGAEDGLGLIAVYPQRSGKYKLFHLRALFQKMFQKIVWFEDPVPTFLLKKYDLMSRNEAYRKIHYPNTLVEMERARRRIAFDEFVRLQAYILLEKRKRMDTVASAKSETGLSGEYVKSLPFALTGAQRRVVDEISESLSSEAPMYRLLQGDVGSGKALPVSGTVLTPSGWVKMGDVVVGLQVVTPHGGVATVTHVFPQGFRRTFKLTFSDGSTARADGEHLWSVRETLSDGFMFDPVLMTTNQLRKEGLLGYKSEASRWSIMHPNMGAISKFSSIAEGVTLVGDCKGIVSITFDGIEENKCIKLTASDGLFITDGWTVTHNTEIAATAVLQSVASGYQSAVLAPTGILATQLFDRFVGSFEKFGNENGKVNVSLFNGEIKGKRRLAIIEGLKNGEIDVVVGTHSLVGKDVEYKNLGLVVVDEQHKFGSVQRSNVRKVNGDGSIPDMLMMSATPIPRTTAQVIYGNMDISVIDELPVGRKAVKTFWEETPEVAYDKIREEVSAGKQAYVVTALVEESEAETVSDLESATKTYTFLQGNVFPEFRVGLLHGRLKPSEKREIVDKFRSKEIDILVATTIVEVGVNVANASVMVVLDVNRYGIASLHQIRGRVGRGEEQAYCYLIGQATTIESEQRLSALVASTDGFWLAEKDLEIRGEGSLFDSLQVGSSSFYVANLSEHRNMLGVATAVANQAVKSVALVEEVETVFSGKKILL